MIRLDWKAGERRVISKYKNKKGLTMLSLFTKRPCVTSDLTIMHLERKLKRYERRTQRPNAKQSDHNTRRRLAVQLAEAQTYLC